MQKMKQETVEVSKDVLNEMVDDIENLLENIELIVERESMKRVKNRLKDVKEGRVKTLSEKDFKEFMRKEGIDAG
jgi:hypothetical protein